MEILQLNLPESLSQPLVRTMHFLLIRTSLLMWLSSSLTLCFWSFQTDVAQLPSLSLNGNQTGSYAVIMLDLSVEANGPTAPNTTLLHWILPGLSSSPKSTATTTALLSDEAPIAPYYPPGPPANQTHTYALYLYDVPATFTVPTDYVPYFSNLTASVYNRVGFNVTDFAERSGLGEPVAANWYLISNTTTATASSSGVATTVSSTGVAASASTFAGFAAGKGVEMGFFAMVFGVAGILSSTW